MLFGIEQYPLILATSVFLFLMLVVYALLSYLQASAEKKKLIFKIRSGAGVLDGYDAGEKAYGRETPRFLEGLFDFLARIGRKKVQQVPSSYSPARLRFMQAGLRGPSVPAVFWGTKLLLGLALPFIFFVFRLAFGDFFNTFLKTNQTLLLTVLLALTGYLLPDIWLRDRTNRRKVRLQHALPDALDFMVVCVEAGLGMNAAISRVGDEIIHTHKDLGEELRIANLEIRAGKARRDALRNFALRTDLEDVRQLVTVLLQTERFGTSLTQALRVFSESFRQRRSEIAEERAHKLPVKLVFPMMLFIFPAIFVFAGAPAITQLVRALTRVTGG